MAKSSGLGAGFYVDQYDLTDDYGSIDTLSKSLATIDQTGLRSLAFQRVNGKLMGEIGGTAFFNPTNAHVLHSDLSRNDRVASYFHREEIGVPVASMVAKQMNYDPTRDMDGGLEAAVQLLSNAYWLDWGISLTAGKRTDGSATNGAAVDFDDWNAPAAFGAQAYLHVFAFTGTSVTITIQMDTASNFATPTTLATFSVVSGVTKEAIRTARDASVERFLRVITTGTFSNVVFAVQATVNGTDMTI